MTTLSRQNRKETAVIGVCLLAVYLFLLISTLTLAFFSHGLSEAFFTELGKGAALIGFALLTLQVVLSTRFKFIDRPFGLDVVMHFHKHMAIFATVLLLSHPMLLALGHKSIRLFTFETSWQVNLGKVALLLLLLTILFAISFKMLRVNYQVWRFIHKGAIFIVILGFTHALVIGSDIQKSGMKIYFWTLLVIAIGIFIYRNLFVPLWGRQHFEVISVTQETYNTWNLALKPKNNQIFPYQPGQFMFLKLLREGYHSEEHPFTISSSPIQKGIITATIKESGDYTRTIGQTKPGDTALIEAPFGRFSLVHHKAKSFLFVAGGVGLTPIISMLRYLRDTKDERPVTFIYGNRTENDIIFRDELETLPRNVKLVHVLSEPDSQWQGARGYVNEQIIRDYAGNILGHAHIYICGPPLMMENVISYLKTIGIKTNRIHYERFAL